MLHTIYCCRFGQRGRRAVFVVLSAVAPRILRSAARAQTAEASRTRQFFGMTGIGRVSRPLLERQQERPRLSETPIPGSAASPLPVVSPRRRRVLSRSSRFHL